MQDPFLPRKVAALAQPPLVDWYLLFVALQHSLTYFPASCLHAYLLPHIPVGSFVPCPTLSSYIVFLTWLLTGINRKELLRHEPMPPLNYDPVSASSSTSQYTYNPLAVVSWDMSGHVPLSDAIVNHTEAQTGSGSFAAPLVPTFVAFFGSETGALVGFISGVIDPACALLQDGGDCCGVTAQQYVWAPQSSSLPPDSHNATPHVPVTCRTKPDVELVDKRSKKSCCTIEVKKR